MKKNIPLILLILLFISLLFFGNYQFAKKQPGGTDFLYRWLPTQLVLFENYKNPYSPAAEYQVELVHHGHPHQDDETPGIFAYPYYTMAVFLPFAFIKDFLLARAAWMTAMEVAHIGVIWLTLQMAKFKPKKSVIFTLIIFALFSADFSQALIDGNPSSLATFFAFLSLFFISRKADKAAGICLALSTIKPQLVILFFPLIWFWAFSRQRWTILYSSFFVMLVLFSASFFLLPNWFSEFIKDLTTYTNVASPSTPRAILNYWMAASLANYIAWGLTVLSILIILRTVLFSIGKDFSALLWSACLIFTVMPITGITSAKSNYIAMLPGVILLIWHAYGKLREKEIWLNFLLFLWIGLSWFFFYAGRNWVINGNLIYFVDFYPLPVVLLALYFFASPFKSSNNYTRINAEERA
ncbi:MAG: hypothetical protein CVU44_05160 [Chloroflexi bacterium HGW-Chloroflexi-6]|nr:MAG: hypothetical protein CVU44_05160 [Chloroflexi bacterium HGW-Chloroflexi-6]